MKKKNQLIISILLIISIVLSLSFLVACGKKIDSDSSNHGSESTTNEHNTEGSENQMIKAVTDGFVKKEEKTNFVEIVMDSGHAIVIELKPDKAPLTVANFQKLVSEKFYDGLIFHRIIKGFMIQGGDPYGIGTGGSKETIKGEFLANGVENDLSHTRGVISMARTNDPNSATSQFFICDAPSTFLDGKYAAFGVVVAGMDEVDRIASLKTGTGDRPLTPPSMTNVYFVAPADEGK